MNDDEGTPDLAVDWNCQLRLDFLSLSLSLFIMGDENKHCF
jgi:hypothetical protein